MSLRYKIRNALSKNFTIIFSSIIIINTSSWNHRLHLWTWTIGVTSMRCAKLRESYIYFILRMFLIAHILIKVAWWEHNLDNCLSYDISLKYYKSCRMFFVDFWSFSLSQKNTRMKQLENEKWNKIFFSTPPLIPCTDTIRNFILKISSRYN